MKAFLVFLSVILSCNGDSSNLDKILRSDQMFENITLLSSDLLYKLNPGHCYTLITDPLYNEILQMKLFDEIGASSSYFVIQVPFNEDMLMPKNVTLMALREAHRAGCGCYLIYLANGIQMSRFLRFIDRERAIQAEAKLIILYDHRLFGRQMHYIWKRFVNVVFVRQIEHTFHGNRSSASNTVFELSTVPYPLAINEVFVTKRLTFWSNGRFQHNTQLNLDKTNNLDAQRMLVCVLKHTPGVFVDYLDESENETVYSGLEVEIIRGMAQSINFTIEFYETPDASTEQWGKKSENGTFSGLLGEMMNGGADIAIGDLYYIPYHLDVMDLSVPYTSQCLTFLTPEALSDNSWQTLVLPFSKEMWAGVLFFLFCVGFVFYIFEHINIWIQKNRNEAPPKSSSKINLVESIKIEMDETPFLSSKFVFKRQRVKKTRDIFHDFNDCILYTYSMLLVVSLPRFPQKWAVRLLTGWYWIYCILVVVAYRASLTAILANPVPRLTIDTLSELATSPIACGVWGEENRKFFSTSTDEVSHKIGEKIELIDSAEDAINRVSQGKFAYYENEYFLIEMRHHHDQIEANKLKYLHIMKECAINMPISIGLAKNSPLKSSFDRVLRQVIEAGLINKWLSDSKRRFESSIEEPPQEALMNLKKLYGILIALLIGFCLALLALIGENLYWRFVTKKNPLYDKYDPIKLYQ